MRAEPISILLDEKYKLDKNFYFVSGNEITLIEKIAETIVKKYQKNKAIEIKRIDTIEDFKEEPGLFNDNKLYLGKSCKGINEKNLETLKNTNGVFVFVYENVRSIKKIKDFFLKDKDSYLIDCYELNKESKIKLLNIFLKTYKLKADQDIFWFLIDKLDNRYIFFENNLNKLLDLGSKEINQENINKLFAVDSSNKEQIFFYLLKRNKEIISIYREKITSSSDVNELYYFCKFFCQLIINSNSEEEYNKKIPVYLFKEKKTLIDIYKKFSFKKKKLLLNLLYSTEKTLRKESGLSLISGLRFLLTIKKITIS